jgi:YegS/Rv2252/BmrU family lipid kinase
MILFIVNPISGHGNKRNVVSRLSQKDCRVVYTEYAGHAEQLAREAEEDIVVAVGGDGTVNEVARGLIGTGKTLGIIPKGSGDGLALHLGLSHDINRNIRTIENGKTEYLDAATINGHHFFSVCGIGLDAIISERFAKSGHRGLASYIEQAIRSWKGHKTERYEIEIDGKKLVHDAVMVTVGNSNQWGNGAKVTPLADSSDGILDMTVVEDFKDIDIPMLAYRLMTGTVNLAQNIHCHKGKDIRIIRQNSGPAHVDGDWFEADRVLEINILKHALKVIVP